MTHGDRYSTKIKTAAVNLPLSLGEVKASLSILDSDDTQDANLMGTLRGCVLATERYTRRTFITTTWTMFKDRFPGKALPWWDGVRQMADTELTDLTESIIVPRPPLISITSIKAHKQDGNTTTVTATDYIVDSNSEPARVALKVSKTWPTDALRAINGVEVEFVAGYGPTGSDVPAPIREAILLCVAESHNNREGVLAKVDKVGETSISRFSPEDIPVPARGLLGSYKVWKL